MWQTSVQNCSLASRVRHAPLTAGTAEQRLPRRSLMDGSLMSRRRFHHRRRGLRPPPPFTALTDSSIETVSVGTSEVIVVREHHHHLGRWLQIPRQHRQVLYRLLVAHRLLGTRSRDHNTFTDMKGFPPKGGWLERSNTASFPGRATSAKTTLPRETNQIYEFSRMR